MEPGVGRLGWRSNCCQHDFDCFNILIEINFHAVKCLDLKCTIKWAWKILTGTPTKIKSISITPKSYFVPFLSQSLHHIGNHWSVVSIDWSAFSQVSYQEITSSVLHNVKFHPCWYKHQKSIPFHCHCLDMAQFIYVLWWTLGLIPVWATILRASVNICVQVRW